MSEDGRTGEGFVLRPVHLAVVTGVFYAVGFLIASQHFGRYLPSDVSPLRMRYLGAAGLYVGMLVLPVAATTFVVACTQGYFLQLGRSSADSYPRLGDLWAARTSWDSALGSAVFGQTILVGSLFVSTRTGVLVGVSSMLVVSWFTYRIARVAFPTGPSEESTGKHNSRAVGFSALILVAFYLLLLSAYGFRLFAYPRMDPGLGGGAGRMARVELDGNRSVVHAGVLADRNSEMFALVQCQRGTLGTAVYPLERMTRLELGEPVPLVTGALTEALCGPE